METFPTKSAEIKQTLPQMTFSSQRQLVALLVVSHHLLELLIKTNLKGILKKGMMQLWHKSIGKNSCEK